MEERAAQLPEHGYVYFRVGLQIVNMV